MHTTGRIIIGISGASGIIYGIRLLEFLRETGRYETHLVMSSTARLSVTIETDMEVAEVEALADFVYNNKDFSAPIASGSFRTDGMIIAPCSMRTLSAVVSAHSDNLLTRAADVTLKERRRLVLMPRETPVHAGHCRLMHEASLMGAVVFLPVPAFYTRPSTIDDIVNETAGRVLDLYGIETGKVKRWGEAN